MKVDYYKYTGRLPLAARVSLRARRKMFERFMEALQPSPTTSVLDLGVTCEMQSADANYFERWYPHPARVVCAGTEDGRELERAYPGVTFVPVEAGRNIFRYSSPDPKLWLFSLPR